MKHFSKKSIAAVLASCFVMACSQNENKSPSIENPGIANSLYFEKPAPGPGLTKEEAQKIKKAFFVIPQMILPPGELIFPAKDMDQQEVAQKESELYRQDKNAYSLLMDLRSNCRTPHPRIEFDATFPSESPISTDVLERGDRAIGKVSANLLGANCLVNLGGAYGGGAEVLEIDHSEKSLSAKANVSAKLNAVMKNPKYAKLLGTRGIIMQSDLSGLALVRELPSQTSTGKVQMNFNLHGSYLSLSEDIPYQIKFEVLTSGNPDGSSTTEITTDSKVIVPDQASVSIKAWVQNTTSQDGTVNSKSEIYLNGKLVTYQELADLFGESAQVMTGKTQIIESLK